MKTKQTTYLIQTMLAFSFACLMYLPQMILDFFFQISAMDFEQEVSFSYISTPEKVENNISNWI